MLANTGRLALRTITLSFRSQITWNLPALVLELVEWLNNPQLSTTSKVGLLSSPSFLDLVEPYVGAETSISFQRMLYAESLAYTQPTSDEKHHLSVPELQKIGAIGGHNVLNFLDLKLKSDSLRSSSKHDLEAVFLLLVGTILAVGYSYPNTSVETPVSRMGFEHFAFIRSQTNSLQNSSTNNTSHYSEFQAMQSHLCQILAHYVVYIGSRLNLPIANDAERFILEAAPKRWHKERIFRWLTASEQRQQREDVLPHYVDAKCNNGTLCTRSKTNGIFTLNRVEFQNTVATHAYEPSLLNKVDGSSWHNTPEISNTESALQQPKPSSSTHLAQPSRFSESIIRIPIPAVSNSSDPSSESKCPGNGPQMLWNTSSQIEYESFSLPEDYRIYKPLSISETLFGRRSLWFPERVPDVCGAILRADREETQNLLV